MWNLILAQNGYCFLTKPYLVIKEEKSFWRDTEQPNYKTGKRVTSHKSKMWFKKKGEVYVGNRTSLPKYNQTLYFMPFGNLTLEFQALFPMQN